MYTQCPKCRSQRPVSVEDLRSSGGMLNCHTCSSTYDALKLLSKGYVPGKKKKAASLENQAEEVKSEVDDSYDKAEADFPMPWGLASSFCLLLFIFQVYFFEGYNLTQNTKLRPWVEIICAPLGCQLPVYKNLNEFTLLQGTLEPTNNGQQYIFKAAFTNQSAFTQKIPSIKLTLIDYIGVDFAERVFHPEEFSKQDSDMIEPDMTSEVTIDIANPDTELGGYRFKLI